MPRFDRARTLDEKEEVLLAILIAWRAHPQLRLGQFIFNALAEGSWPECNTGFHNVIFQIEDGALANKLLSFRKELDPPEENG